MPLDLPFLEASMTIYKRRYGETIQVDALIATFYMTLRVNVRTLKKE